MTNCSSRRPGIRDVWHFKNIFCIVKPATAFSGFDFAGAKLYFFSGDH